jgi:Cu-Zn family superoxide dismutase
MTSLYEYPKYAICVLRSEIDDIRGLVQMQQLEESAPTRFHITIQGIKPGKHGIHIHRSGNILEGATTLCDHFNPFGMQHGGRNDPEAHLGDLGNIEANESGEVNEVFDAEFIQLSGDLSIIGRSIVVHSDEDDLGLGNHKDSKTTGHSGKRILWGIIGVDESCN